MPSSSNPLVAVRLVFSVGSKDDPAGKEGLAALTAALVSQGGTRELTYSQILEKLYPMAASVQGACRKEATVFSGVVHRDHLADYQKLLAKIIVEPRFSPEDFQRLREQAISSIAKTLRGSNDEELGKWGLQVQLYRNHPYGHVDAGTVQALKSITLDDVKTFYRKYYTQPNLAIGLAGGVDQGGVDRLKTELSRLPNTTSPVVHATEPEAPEGLETTIIEKPADSTAISLGFPISITRKDPDFYPLLVACSHLGEHRTFNGKLMQDLRGKRGLNYGDYAYIEDFIEDDETVFAQPNNPRPTQYFSIWIRPVSKANAAFTLRAAFWEFDRFVERGLTEAEFERTRAFLLNYSKLWTQTVSRRLGAAMDGKFYKTQDVVSELANRLPKMTQRDVNDAIHRRLKSKGFAVVIVSDNAQKLADILQSGAPTPAKYESEGTPGDALAEDKIIESYPLKKLKITIVPVKEMFER